jgi:hypothetical protein
MMLGTRQIKFNKVQIYGEEEEERIQIKEEKEEVVIIIKM